MNVLTDDAVRNEILTRISKCFQFYNSRLARGEEPCFFVCLRTIENTILGFPDGGTVDPVIQVRDRRNIRCTDVEGALQMVRIMQIATALLTTKRTLTQRCMSTCVLTHIHFPLTYTCSHRMLWYENQDLFRNQEMSNRRLHDVAIMLNCSRLTLGFSCADGSFVAGMLLIRFPLQHMVLFLFV